MDSLFLASIFAEPPQVLGKKLKPFCCGHAVLLDALESPFIRSGSVEMQDFVLAVWICSMSYADGRKKLLQGKEATQVEGKEWGQSVGVFTFSEELIHFQKYLEMHTQAPERWEKADSSRQKAPWALSIAINLQRELGWSDEKAWNAPLQEALWAFACINESNGDDSLISEDEREILKVAKKVREEQNV